VARGPFVPVGRVLELERTTIGDASAPK
jgi:hypothetical protein